MTGRERLRATLQSAPVDRRAVAPLLSLYGARLTGCEATTYYTDPQAYTRGQTAVFDLLQPDLLFAPFCLSAEGAAFGGRERFLDCHPPNMAEFAASGPGGLAALEPPDPDRHPRLLYVRRALRSVAERHGAEVMLAATCLSPVDSPALLLGAEAWLRTVLFEEEALPEVFARTVPFFVAWANALLADGADFLVLPVAFCNPAVVTAGLAERVALPVLRDAFAQVRGGIVFHHVGAPLGPFLPLLRDLPNVVGFALDGADSLPAARRALGPDKVLLGNVPGPELAQCTEDEVEERCGEILEEMAGDPRFVLATSGADVAYDTPPANLMALGSAARAGAAGGGGSSAPEPGTSVVACSIFREALRAAQRAGSCPGPIRFLDSALHMVPAELRLQLRSVVASERRRHAGVLVVYGDCHAHMVGDCAGPGVVRVAGLNCCQLLLGRDRNRQLLREGAFIFLPEWVERWREMFHKAFGLDREGVRAAMGEVHSKIVFLRLPGAPLDEAVLEQIAGHLDLPWEVAAVDATHLIAALGEAQGRLAAGCREAGP